jgi:hypothetical protein
MKNVWTANEVLLFSSPVAVCFRREDTCSLFYGNDVIKIALESRINQPLWRRSYLIYRMYDDEDISARAEEEATSLRAHGDLNRI